MLAQLASFPCTALVHTCTPSRTFCYSWPWSRETLLAVQDREWPNTHRLLLKMGGQLGRDEWLRLVTRLLIDVRFQPLDRGSSTTLDAIFSGFYFWYMSHSTCSHFVIFQVYCMKQKSKRRKNSIILYTVDNSYFLFLRLSHLSLGRPSFVINNIT